MKSLSFLEKLKVLVDVSSSSGLCIATFVILMFLIFINITTSRKNKKITKKLYITMYVAITVVLLLQYGKYLTKMFDYMMNNFFIAVYFPNLAIYLAAIITTNIILWKTIFTKKVDKVLKIVNSVVYSIMHYLLVLILSVVSKNSLNVFDNASVYANNKALALISISSTMFIVWIVFLIIYKIIKNINQPETSTNKVKLPKNVTQIITPKRVKEVTKKVLPSNIIEKNYPQTISTRNKLPLNIVERAVPKEVKEKVNIIEIVNESKEKDLLEKYDSMLTINDYKKVLEILKNNNQEEILSTKIETIVEEEKKNSYVQPVLDRLLDLKTY